MLAPEQDESAGLFVGELLLHLLKRAEHAIAPVLPNLLQSLIRRLATAQTASFCQVGGKNQLLLEQTDTQTCH